ncbi:MAG: peptidylprolyl isomerase [Planctomycetes bacterium]|nr:peptidylprolyl isomerase [Planctomycetota bacterium]
MITQNDMPAGQALDSRPIPTTIRRSGGLGSPRERGKSSVMRFRTTIVATCVLASGLSVFGQRTEPLPGLQARLISENRHVPMGQPIRVTFAIENSSNDPITLTVPGTTPQIPSPEVGLPLAHVFSSGSSPSVTVLTPSDRQWFDPLGYRPPKEAPILIIAPHSTVGSSIDLREYYPALRSSGRFRIIWTPYKGLAASDTLSITIAPRKRVELVTDHGTMTLQLFYDDAPAHVANFLELVQQGFYSGTTVHRIEPGYFLVAGCPHGDGTGIRPDGKRVESEINGRAHAKGSVSMALLEDDPDSGSSQFFICYTRQKDFDGRYTVFAQLVGDDSFATLDMLMATQADSDGRPTPRVYLRTARTVAEPIEMSIDSR